MKKFLGIIAVLALVLQPSVAYSADQWAKGQPAGTANLSDIDTLIQTNNAALDRLVNGTKRGLGLNYATASTLTVLPGEIAIPNAAVSTVRCRETTSNTTITWADIDTGAEANSTTYYVYATADTDVTDMVFKISTSSSAPSSTTYYRVIGQFYNNSSGNIESVLSYRPDHGTDYPDVVKAWVNFNGSGTVTINDQYNVSSITDNGTGDYTVTFSTAFANAYYAPAGIARKDNLNLACISHDTLSTGSHKFVVRDADGTSIDSASTTLVYFGDRI